MGQERGTRGKPWRRWRSSGWLLLLLVLPAALARVVKIERMSPPPLDVEVTLSGGSPSISTDGRFVAFTSIGNNSVPGDTNGGIFVWDRQSGKTELVSVSTSGEPANGNSSAPAISPDGRFVAFMSDATKLVPGDTNYAPDIFVRDRWSGKTELVSVTPNGEPAKGHSSFPSISAHGRFVAFVSSASNLVPGDTNRDADVFVWDRQTGKMELVSVSTSGETAGGRSPSISADGRFVAFRSRASNLVRGDTNGAWDVFVRDRQSGKTEVVSLAPSGETAGDRSPSISADGRFVAYESYAENPVPGDTKGNTDVFLLDRQTGKTERVSVTPSGGPANGSSYSWTISADGRFVAFESGASNLVPGDTNARTDLFVRDRQTGKTERVSVAPSGAQTNRDSSGPISISADGRFVAFTITDTATRVVVRDRVAATTKVITASLNVSRAPLHSASPAISADGQWVVFMTGGHVFERNRVTGKASLISAAVSGAPANGISSAPSISADGRFVAFVSGADNLAPGDTNGRAAVFVRDRQSGKTERVGDGSQPAISGDGRFVAFMSGANNLALGDRNNADDIFVRDRQTGKTDLVSVAASGARDHSYSLTPAISADGRFVAFWTETNKLVSGADHRTAAIFVRDRQKGKTELVSVSTSGEPANGYSYSPSISGDGRFVAFVSVADNLVPGDTNEAADIFVRDRQTEKTERVSVGRSDQPGDVAASSSPAISGDGRFVAFTSEANNLVPGDTNAASDVFVRDRQTGKTERVSVTASGAQANGDSGSRDSPAISGDGRFVVFESSATNLVPGDTNGRTDVFVAERE